MWSRAAPLWRGAARLWTPIPVGRGFQIALGLVFLIAWLSLWYQVQILVGSRGLLPAKELIALLRAREISFLDAPTLFHLGAPDWALSLGCLVGTVLAIPILVGRYARVSLAVSTLLYLSYAIICRTFLSFQWDNLLLECGFFAVFLPTERRSRWISFVFKLILFKLYFESGIAKWQSHLHDWQDGSAMSFYYETAPLPGPLAWFMHHLPRRWHTLESWATLGFELGVPFAIFGEKYLRRASFVIFGGFQLINIATANYGFFCYLALALHLFLLEDATPLAGRPGGTGSPSAQGSPVAPRARWRHAPAIALLAGFVFISAVDGLAAFGPREDARALLSLREAWGPFRLVNTYHLFGHITRERIEPEVQSFDGATWTARPFRHKPGDPTRAPGLVAPHQPRVDFQLWFYGLSYRGGTPAYVVNLLERVCTDPAAVERLFEAPLDRSPRAVRLVFWQYHFAPWAEKSWWRREQRDETRPMPCRIDAASESDTTRP
jgi:hypothetical protein